MKRALWFAAVAALLALLAAPPARATLDTIAYYSVSLVKPRTGKLIPLVVYYNGSFSVRRTVKIPYGATFFVKVRAPRNSYLTCAFRDDASTMYDLPERARKMTTGVKEFRWTMPRRFMPGEVEVLFALYDFINEQTKFTGDTLYNSQFIILGKTSLNY